MDEQVLRGMAKWPDVPAVFGWLGLDRRGNWLLKGEPITNPTVVAYIGRNYERDAQGRWFFQNGPQRVFVALDYTPLVYRVVATEPLEIEAHTGKRVTALAGAGVDDEGTLILDTEHGPGIVHDLDLESILPALTDSNGKPLAEEKLDQAMALVEQGREAAMWLALGRSKVKVEAISSGGVPARFGYTQRPAA